MTNINKKQFGLIKSSKPTKALERSSVFGNESSEDEDAKKAVNRSIHEMSVKSRMQRQTQLEIARAIEDDPTVYEYDEVYDAMKEKQEVKSLESRGSSKAESKYIGSLIKHAERRKRDNDRRMERKAQRELEAEGRVSDEESFVTSAYKKRLEEMADDEEAEKREKLEEAKHDVTKQKDLSAFYSNILNSRTGEIPKETVERKAAVKDIKKEPEIPTVKDIKREPDSPPLKVETKTKAKRHYRRRHDSSSSNNSSSSHSSSGEEENTVARKRRHSTDSEEDAPNNVDDKIIPKREDNIQGSTDKLDNVAPVGNQDADTDMSDSSSDKEDLPSEKQTVAMETINAAPKRKVKRNVFAKRNTPETIAAARERYFQRKIKGVCKPMIVVSNT